MGEVLSEYIIIGNQPTQIPFFEKENLPISCKEFFSISNETLEPTFKKYKALSRSLARDGYFGLHCLDQVLQKYPFTIDPHRVGMYTAFSNGPLYQPLAEKICSSDMNESYEFLKMNLSPKQHLKQYGPLRATHFGMQLGLKGPQMCFIDPYSGLIDALNASEVDLFSDQVDYAFVMSAFSFEEPQQVYFYAQKENRLYECGTCLLLKKNSSLTQWSVKNLNSVFEQGLCSPYTEKNYSVKFFGEAHES